MLMFSCELVRKKKLWEIHGLLHEFPINQINKNYLIVGTFIVVWLPSAYLIVTILIEPAALLSGMLHSLPSTAVLLRAWPARSNTLTLDMLFSALTESCLLPSFIVVSPV